MMGIVYGRMNLASSRMPSSDHTSCNPSKAKSSIRGSESDNRSASSEDSVDANSSSNDGAPDFRRVTRQSSLNRARREAPVVLRRSARLRSDNEIQSAATVRRSANKRPSRVRRSARIALLGVTITSTGRGSAASRITTRSRSSMLREGQAGTLASSTRSSLSSSMNLRRSLRRISS